MSRQLDKAEMAALEDMIDETSVGHLLEKIAEICWEKAEHVQSNWQDDALAKAWRKAGTRIDALSGKLDDLP